MRNYYLHAAEISRLTTLIIHRVTDCDEPLSATIWFRQDHARRRLRFAGTALRHEAAVFSSPIRAISSMF